MTSYDILWDFAEDHYGLITTAQAMAMGIDKHRLPAMAQRGTLIKKGYGVYLVKHHVPREKDVYAHSVALAGEMAYLRGASVIAMFKLAPTNPGVVYLGSGVRVRRQLPPGIILRDRCPCKFVLYEGIRIQPLVEALRTAYDEGMLEADRIVEASCKARQIGLLTQAESRLFAKD